MTEEKETTEVKEPIIGKFKPKRHFLNFVSAVNGAKIRFIRDIAFVKGHKLSGILEGSVFKITICDEGTINFEEVEGQKSTPQMIQRLIDDIDEMDVIGYAQKFVVHGLEFADIDGKLCYLEVEHQKPVDKLRGLFDEPKAEVSQRGLSILDQLFGDTDQTEEETQVVEKEVPTDTKSDEEVAAKSFLEEQFQKMNEDKINELKSRIEQKQTEVNGYQRDISTAETRLKKASEDLKVLQTRLESFGHSDEPNGFVFWVSEEQKFETGLDESTKGVADKIADIMGLKKEVLFDYLTGGYYKIKLAKVGELEATIEKLDAQIIEKLFSIDANGKFSNVSETEFEYRGELNWHQLVGKMIKRGFSQSPEFDKVCQSNSYVSKEEDPQTKSEGASIIDGLLKKKKKK
jgi:hypothetical protein